MMAHASAFLGRGARRRPRSGRELWAAGCQQQRQRVRRLRRDNLVRDELARRVGRLGTGISTGSAGAGGASNPSASSAGGSGGTSTSNTSSSSGTGGATPCYEDTSVVCCPQNAGDMTGGCTPSGCVYDGSGQFCCKGRGGLPARLDGDGDRVLHGAQLGDLVVGDALGRAARRVALEVRPEVVDVAHLLGRERADCHAAPRAHDEVLPLQLAERLPDRSAADLELAREALLDDALSGPQRAVQDRAPDGAERLVAAGRHAGRAEDVGRLNHPRSLHAIACKAVSYAARGWGNNRGRCQCIGSRTAPSSARRAPHASVACSRRAADARIAVLWVLAIVPQAFGFWLVAGDVAGVAADERRTFLLAGLLTLALATLAQVTFGYRLALYEGPAAGYLASVIVVASGGHDLAEITGGMIVAGVTVIVLEVPESPVAAALRRR